MQSQVHMKKFFEDTYSDSTMYPDYLSGKLYLNMDFYTKWYKEMRVRRDIFFDAVKATKNFRGSTSFFETSLHEDFFVTEKIFDRKSFEVKEASFPKIEEYSLGSENHHYICNGCYETTLENIYNVLNKGAFTVGVCCDKKSSEYKAIVKYYNELKDFLMRKGYRASSYESSTSGKNKVYLLMYDSYKQNKK